MTEREIEILIHETLDGTATAEQRKRLEEALAGSQRARARRRELEGLFRSLKRIEARPAPADLRDRVLQALATAPSPRTRSRRGAAIRLAYVFAAGLAAGVVAMGAWTGMRAPGGPGGEPPVGGTMMPARPPATGTPRRVWEAGGARLEAASWRAGERTLVGLELLGEGPTDVELSFDAQGLQAAAIRRQGAPDGRLEIEPGRLVLRAAAPAAYLVEFRGRPRGAPVRVLLRSAGAAAGGELPLASGP